MKIQENLFYSNFESFLKDYLNSGNVILSKDESKNSRYIDFLKKLYNCKECYIRKLVLPGTGNLDAEIVFIGEAPSLRRTYHLTFGERSRTIFEAILRTMKLSRDKVWATNIVKCTVPLRSTGNIENCKKYLIEELEIINPRYLILLGKVARESLIPLNLNYKIFFLPHPMTCVYDPRRLDKVLESSKRIYLNISNSIERWFNV